MFVGICVGGWDRGVGEVVVFNMGTWLLTAAGGTSGEMLKDTVLEIMSLKRQHNLLTYLP